MRLLKTSLEIARRSPAETALASAAHLYATYADRLDLDDLDDLVVRHRVTGWLQGFDEDDVHGGRPLMWDSRHHAAGLKGLVGAGAARQRRGAGRSGGARAAAARRRRRRPSGLVGTGAPTSDPHLLPGESLAEALERQPREGDGGRRASSGRKLRKCRCSCWDVATGCSV